MSLRLVPLDDSIDVSQFRCCQADGSRPLERFLQKHAMDNQVKNLSVTWVAFDGERIAGYFSLSTASISVRHIGDDDKKDFPPYDYFPAILIGKFAVCDGFRGQGVGRWMMDNIFSIVLFTGKHVGCCYLMVESKDESAGYYERVLRFRPICKDDNGHQVLIRKIPTITTSA